MSSFSSNAVFKPTKRKELIKAVNGYFNNNSDALNKYGPIGTWDISGLKDISSIFSDIEITNANVHLLDGIQNWNTSNITNMDSLFSDVKAASIPYISDWNTSRVQNMSGMFYDSNCNQPLNWDTSEVIDMRLMFSDSSFNSPLNHWNVSKVKYMNRMFSRSQFNQPLNQWNVENVEEMGRMFDSSNFNQPLDQWNVSNVDNFEEMFENSVFNQDISNWSVKIKERAKTINMFNGCPIPDEYNPLIDRENKKAKVEREKRQAFREQQKELASKHVIPTIDNTKFPDCCICQEPLNNIDGPELAESCGGERCRDVIRVCGPTAPHFMHRGCAIQWAAPPEVNITTQMGFDFGYSVSQKRANKCPLCSESMSNNLMDQPQVPNDEILRETYKGGKRKRKTQKRKRKRKTQKRKSSRRTTKKRQYK